MKINVPEKYADLYLKALTEKKKALEARIEEFKKEIEEIDNHISTLTSLPIFQDQTQQNIVRWDPAAYRSQWPWTRKIAHYLDLTKVLITSAEAVSFITDQEPDIDKQKVRSSVSAALSNKIRSGEYKKFTDPITQTAYYGPGEWFRKDTPEILHLPEALKQRLTA
jgi:hypothetical protein